MSRSLVDLPVRSGLIPSWEAEFIDPDDLGDPAGELLAEELGADPAVLGLLAEVGSTPVVEDAVAGRLGGFSSWRDGLGECPDLDLVTGLAETEYLSRVASARQVALVQEFCSRRSGTAWVGGRARGRTDEFTADHLAAALGVSLRSATNRIHEAQALRDYPRILAALGAGLVSMAGVRGFLREVSGLDLVGTPEHAAAVESHVLNRVGEPFLPALGTWTAEALGELPVADVMPLMAATTPGQVTSWARRAVTVVDRDAARKRTLKALGESKVELSGGGGFGMAWLGGWLPEEKAAAGYERIDREARRRLNDPDLDTGSCGDSLPLDGDALSLDAVRAQVFFDLLMNDSSVAPGPVNLTVLVDAEGVATTPGLGPVSAQTVQGFIGLATRTGGRVHRIVQEPVLCPGEHPNGGHDDPYEVPAGMRRFVQLRDRTCRYPGCTRAATGCDLDHTIPWPVGPTCPCNLSALCRHHHRLKTHGPGWSLTNHGHGSMTWRTPYGTFQTRP